MLLSMIHWPVVAMPFDPVGGSWLRQGRALLRGPGRAGPATLTEPASPVSALPGYDRSRKHYPIRC